MTPAARGRWLLGAAVLGTAAGLLWIQQRHGLALTDPEALAAQVRASGAAAPLLLVALLVVQSVIVPLPSQPVLMAGGFVYGAGGGLAIGWVGVLLGACACFAIARVLGRPAVLHFVSEERVDAIDRWVGERGLRSAFVAVLSLRLFAHFSFDATSYACGLVRFPFGWFALATALGEIPKVAIFTFLGAGLGELPGWVGIGIALGAVGSLACAVVLARRAVRTAPLASR